LGAMANYDHFILHLYTNDNVFVRILLSEPGFPHLAGQVGWIYSLPDCVVQAGIMRIEDLC